MLPQVRPLGRVASAASHPPPIVHMLSTFGANLHAGVGGKPQSSTRLPFAEYRDMLRDREPLMDKEVRGQRHACAGFCIGHRLCRAYTAPILYACCVLSLLWLWHSVFTRPGGICGSRSHLPAQLSARQQLVAINATTAAAARPPGSGAATFVDKANGLAPAVPGLPGMGLSLSACFGGGLGLLAEL
jgi:hypothetical protein